MNAIAAIRTDRARRPLTEAERALFTTLWSEGVPATEIAERLGRVSHTDAATRSRMSSLAAAMFLPKRPGGRPAGLPDAVMPESDPTPPARRRRDLSPHPVWTPARDALVLRSHGAYGALANLAVALGLPHAMILQRWHQLRAG